MNRCRAFLWAVSICFLVWLPPAALANGPSQIRPTSVELDADFDAQGNLTIFVHGFGASPDLNQLERSLNDALGSTMEHVPRTGMGTWMLSGHVRHVLRKTGLTCEGSIDLSLRT
jgi:hypothetical protein